MHEAREPESQGYLFSFLGNISLLPVYKSPSWISEGHKRLVLKENTQFKGSDVCVCSDE